MLSKVQSSGGRFSRHPALLPLPRMGFGQCVFRAFLLGLFLNLSGALPVRATPVDEQIAVLKAQMNNAIFKVEDIVNQPVTHLKRTPDMKVAYFSPGWFHDGATKPDFNTVDIRTTQKFPYAGYQYVTSDLNPGEAFIGRELEFNSMTKYFFNDRTVPKKKLTEAEMLEINQLYRVIGRCEQQLNELQNPVSPLAILQQWAERWAPTHQPILIALAVAVIAALLFVRKKLSKGPEYRWR
jgi:hypothetical protein